jgi:ATP-dependent DNA helicase RecG
MKQLEYGESDRVEFKEKPTNLEKEIVAFANAKGGAIYIGVRDDGSVRGFKLDNSNHSRIINSLHNCDPMPDFTIREDSGFVVLEISEGLQKPYRAPDGFYKRFGATSQKLNRDQILEIAIKESKVRFDKQILKWVKDLEDSNSELIDMDKFTRWRELTGIDPQIKNVNLLSNFGLIDMTSRAKQIGATNALVLLFSANVSTFFPQARVICWIMKDDISILKQFLIKGDLFQQLEESIVFLESYLQETFVIEGVKRKDVAEIPRVILRELIINALIHRNYFEAGAEVQIKLYPDKLTIANPSLINSDIEVDKLFGNSLRPNPLLAEIFERAGFIERAGTGLLRVSHLLTTVNLPKLKITIEGPFFVAEISRVKLRGSTSSYSKWQKSIIEFIGQSVTGKSSSEIADHLGISTRAVRNELLPLIKFNVIEQTRHGRNIKYRLL